MQDRTFLRERIWAAIDAAQDEITALGEGILDNPELGSRELATAAHLAGRVVSMAVPAEEYVEIEYRLGLVRQ